MSANLTTANALLKDIYLAGVRQQLNNEVPFLSQIERNKQQVEGNQVHMLLHVGRNAGIGNRADGADLPTPGNQAWVQTSVKVKHAYGVFQLTGPLMRAAKSDKGSFERALTAEMEGNTDDIKRDMNRQLWGTSDGIIATAGVTTASTTVVLAAATSRTQLNQLGDMINATVDIVTFSGGVATPITNGSAVTMSAVDKVNKTITISGAGVTTTGANSVVRSGSGGSGASQVEVTGVQTQVKASGVLFGVDPATYPSWVSTVNDPTPGTQRSVSEPLIEQQLDDVHDASGKDVNLMTSDRPTRRAVAALMQTQKRYANTIDLKGGFKGLSVSVGDAEVPLMTDRDTPANAIYGFRTDTWSENSQSDWEFMQEDGGGILIRSTTKDAYTGVMLKDMELVCDQRNANFALLDLIAA